MTACTVEIEEMLISLVISIAISIPLGFFLYKLKLKKTKHKKTWLIFDIILTIGLLIGIFALLINVVFWRCYPGIYSEFINFTYYEKNNTCILYKNLILKGERPGHVCEEWIECAKEQDRYKNIKEGTYYGECLRITHH